MVSCLRHGTIGYGLVRGESSVPLHLNRRSGFIDRKRAHTAVPISLELGESMDELTHAMSAIMKFSYSEKFVSCTAKDQSSIKCQENLHRPHPSYGLE